MMSVIIKIQENLVYLVNICKYYLWYAQKDVKFKISYAIIYGIYIKFSFSKCAWIQTGIL
jgi:hypothetical protein